MGVAILALVAISGVLLAVGDDAEAPDRPPTLRKPPPQPLHWPQPALDDPADVHVSSSNRALELDPARDYVVHMPSTPLNVTGGLTISGGRNVVLVGGRIRIPWQGRSPVGHQRRALFLEDQRGTIHVEGLRMDGPDISEGINLDQGYGATVQLENLRIDGLHARDEHDFTDTHPDLIQTWNGPDRLLVDRLTGSSDYQGFFLRPQETGGPVPTLFALRNVNLIGSRTAGYLLWKASPFPLRVSKTWVAPNPRKSMRLTLWPRRSAWPAVKRGRPRSGDFVPRGVAGIRYASPGAAARCHYVSTVGRVAAPRLCR